MGCFQMPYLTCRSWCYYLVRCAIVLLATVIAHPSVAQEFLDNQPVPESRFALLIGNQGYPLPWKLDTPTADVKAIGARLAAFGFNTTILIDASFSETLVAVDRYRRALKSATGRPVGVFYYAGHGFSNEADEENFLIPIGNIGSIASMMDESVSLNLLLSLLSHDNGNAAQIVMIDACRSALGIPSNTRDFVPVSRGFSPVSARGGIAMMLSTRPGHLAYDRTSMVTEYSPFATALLEILEKPGLGTLAFMGEVMVRTAELTKAETPSQIPEVYASSGTQISLHPASAPPSRTDLPPGAFSIVVRAAVTATRGPSHELVATLEAQGFSDILSDAQPLLADPAFLTDASELLNRGLGREALSALITQYTSALPSDAELKPKFYYYATGDLLPGSGVGLPDPTNYAPDIVFPVLSDQVAVSSQLYRSGGIRYVNIAEGMADSRGPVPIWRDNFCEAREFSVPACPGGRGHQGVDLVDWSEDGPDRSARGPPIIAVESGVITRRTNYTTLELLGDSGRVWRYVHLEIGNNIRAGRRVEAGERLGVMADIMGGKDGGTSLHLHLDLRVDGTFRNPYPALLAAYERRVGPGRQIADGDRYLSISLDR